MSYLSRPRIGFVAHDAMTNPSTANNENVVHLLDYDDVRLLNPPMATGPDLPKMSHAAYREWMTTMITYSDPFDPKLAPGAQPPSATGLGGSDWQPGMPGYWNYWGDHLTTFGSAAINSVWIGADPVTDPAADALIGSRVLYNARIVDVDPADTFTTQFVCARFAVLGHDRSGQPAELVAGVLTTSFTRFLNFFRPRGAGSFQAVIPLAGLAFIADAEAPDSAGFRALRDGCRDAGGLLVRHCLFAMKAAKKMPEMYERFQQNDPATNPKIGSVVGSIGVWREGDLPASPVGRLLHQPGLPFFGTGTSEAAQGSQRRVKTHEDVEKISTKVVKATAAPAPPDVTTIGPAVAVVDDGAEGGPVVALDLLTTFPEAGAPPDPLAKVDFGPAALVLVEGDDTTKVGEVRYDRTTYDERAGVWEVAVPPGLRDRLGEGALALVATVPGEPGQKVLLQEIPCAQIESEQLATYLDLAPSGDGGGVAATATIRLRAFVKGEPAAVETPVIVQRFHDFQVPGEVNSLSPLVLTATQLREDPVGDVEHVVIPAGGVLDLPVEATSAGCFKLRFLPEGIAAEPSTSPNFAVEFFASFRALPHHDYSGLTDDEITWPFVYEHVFAYYSILYPIMGSIIPWGPSNTPSDPDRVGQFASLIRQAVDASRLDSALQMPITRELSAGKRALVQRWCDLQLRTT